MKYTIKESQLREIISEAVKRVLKEEFGQNQEIEEGFLGNLFGNSNKPKPRRSGGYYGEPSNPKDNLQHQFNKVATQKNRENNRIMKQAYDNGKITQDQYNQHRNPYNGKKMMSGEQ